MTTTPLSLPSLQARVERGGQAWPACSTPKVGPPHGQYLGAPPGLWLCCPRLREGTSLPGNSRQATLGKSGCCLSVKQITLASKTASLGRRLCPAASPAAALAMARLPLVFLFVKKQMMKGQQH